MPTETCQCTTCGYEWPRGRSGDHNCSDTLLARIVELQNELHAARQPPQHDLAGTTAELSLYRSSQRIITLSVLTQAHGLIEIEVPESAFTDVLFGIAATQAPIRRHFPRKRPRPS